MNATWTLTCVVMAGVSILMVHSDASVIQGTKSAEIDTTVLVSTLYLHTINFHALHSILRTKYY